MDKNKDHLLELLEYIDPASLDYQEWVNVGMALKTEGYSSADWESWSRKDHKRFHEGECKRKWDSFKGAASPVTGGTIVQMAKDRGWMPETKSHELEWDSIIGERDLSVIDKDWVERTEIRIPSEWDPAKQLITYLETLFDSTENVGYVTESWEKDGRYMPTSGCYDRTAGQLIQDLNECNGDIGAVLGDYNEEAGAWIRFNPLDGKGVKNSNVTDYRYALVESDSTDIELQNSILRELNLPIACLVHSGKKSLHAIVRIDAGDYSEYRKRVDYLYEVCAKNGLQVDRQNKNPSRLSRMPGVIRGGRKQYLLDTNIGKSSWSEWVEWIESANDDLPDPENIADVWDDMPALSPPLIDGVLRKGHKMLIAGASKAGKSYALIEMAIAIAEGRDWFGWKCAKGRVLYVNLELDRASCLHRFKDVYEALGFSPENLQSIDIWNLRGKSVPMDKLAPKLIRRANKKDYIAVIIDPIYKVITGDENSADQMAHFCNQFDKVCTELGCSVIYCHHHSKGRQGAKRSMDRASGSGVFARDPDALLDLIQLEVPKSLIEQETNKAVCELCAARLREYDHQDDYFPEDAKDKSRMLRVCLDYLDNDVYEQIEKEAAETEKAVQRKTAWRIEGTLREYPSFAPVNLWFDYPIHKIDRSGALANIQTEEEKPFWQKGVENRKSKEQKRKERCASVETAFSACASNGKANIKDMAEYMGVSEKTVRSRLKEHGGYWNGNSEVVEKNK